MLTCDICKQCSPAAKNLDYVILSILKEAPLTHSVRGEILDKLGINTSLLKPKTSFGDVCETCGQDLSEQISDIVASGIASISDGILGIAKQTKAKLTTQNQQLFAQMAGEWTK